LAINHFSPLNLCHHIHSGEGSMLPGMNKLYAFSKVIKCKSQSEGIKVKPFN